MKTLGEPLVRTINITMPGRLGFHFLVAVRFLKCVQGFRSSIRIRKGKVLVDGKSILGLLLLGAAWKSKLEIVAVGDDAAQAIESIEEFFLNQEHIKDGL